VLAAIFFHEKEIMRPLSQDLRERIVAVRVPARFANVLGSAAKVWSAFGTKHRLTGSCQPKKIGGYRRSRLEKHDTTLRRWLAAQTDLTLSELQKTVLGALECSHRHHCFVAPAGAVGPEL